MNKDTNPQTATPQENPNTPEVATGWREATKEEFFQAIGRQNVHPRPVGPWPYTSLWETPHKDLLGKSVLYIPEGSGLPETQYLLPKVGAA